MRWTQNIALNIEYDEQFCRINMHMIGIPLGSQTK